MAAFPKQIQEVTKGSSITLKYPRKDLDGTMYWANIRSAMESPEVWIPLCNSGERIPTVGVAVDEAVDDESPVEPFPVGSMLVCEIEEPLKWVAGPSPKMIAPPLTYKVRYSST